MILFINCFMSTFFNFLWIYFSFYMVQVRSFLGYNNVVKRGLTRSVSYVKVSSKNNIFKCSTKIFNMSFRFLGFIIFLKTFSSCSNLLSCNGLNSEFQYHQFYHILTVSIVYTLYLVSEVFIWGCIYQLTNVVPRFR